MSARSNSPSPLRRLLLPVLVAAYLGYFGFHALSGSYGLKAHAEFKAEEVSLEAELTYLRDQRAALEQRAALVRSGSLDPDMIDELARRSLNVIAPNEVVLLP